MLLNNKKGVAGGTGFFSFGFFRLAEITFALIGLKGHRYQAICYLEDLDSFLFGTFAPFFRASLRPMAMACLRLVTFFPLRPERSVPAFSLCKALWTVSCAF